MTCSILLQQQKVFLDIKHFVIDSFQCYLPAKFLKHVAQNDIQLGRSYIWKEHLSLEYIMLETKEKYD